MSVRSGSAMSMPGMMDTILNLGLNEETLPGLIRADRESALRLRRLAALRPAVRQDRAGRAGREVRPRDGGAEGARAARVQDVDLSAEALRELADDFLDLCREHTGTPFPADPVRAARARRSRRCSARGWASAPSTTAASSASRKDMANGTAVNVCTMVFGNMGDDSATGVGFTRNPGTGENVIYGEYLVNAQGEDVVAGIRTPKPIAAMAEEMPELYRQLVALRDRLEAHYREVQDFEFTIERGRLYCLQTRNGKMNARAMVVTSVEMFGDGLITREQALTAHPPDAAGAAAGAAARPRARARSRWRRGCRRRPGAASGRIVFDADTAEERGKIGDKVMLVREETKPEDIHGFFAAQAILTSRGGKTSHAAVVARGMGKPCVSGCEAIVIDVRERRATRRRQSSCARAT